MGNDTPPSVNGDWPAGVVPKMPGKFFHLEFYIDTNRINARQGLPHMNRLEKWHKDGVICIQMPDTAHDEAIRGNSPARVSKGRSYIYSVVPQERQQYRHVLQSIKGTLFPSEAQTQGQKNDVMIVYNIVYYMSILVTNDGDSVTQPNGILGNRDKLTKYVQVMRDSEAVALVEERIRERDERARRTASMTGQPLLERVGKY
jgi:hypothetical protein